MELARSDGFFLGAMVWNYGLIVFGVLPVFVGLFATGLIGGTVFAVLCLTAGLLLPMVLYPWAWSLWLMTYFLALPHELPGNEDDGHQDGSEAS